MDVAASLEWQQGFFPGELEQVEEAPFALASTRIDDTTLVTTLDFQHVDSGLEAMGLDVRAEVFALSTEPLPPVAAVVREACELVAASNFAISAQPGTILPALADFARLPGEISARHGLFIAPSTWEEGVPQVVEESRMVLMLQLIMLTQAEFEFALTHSAQELLAKIASEQVPVLDWRRSP
ncbi:suppressor of fused domain protein [Corynebacterium sp. 35RC1]|nr:suppressor of fused domain protein [Corynebacterium sp. 35RC1]